MSINLQTSALRTMAVLEQLDVFGDGDGQITLRTYAQAWGGEDTIVETQAEVYE